EEPATENTIVPLAGERASYTDVIATFEAATGRSLTVQHVPEQALAAQRDAASDEREKTFAGLMLGVASGSPPGDGEQWLRGVADEHERPGRRLDALVVELRDSAPAQHEVELLAASVVARIVRLLDVRVHDLLSRLRRDERVRRELADPEMRADLRPRTPQLQ